MSTTVYGDISPRTAAYASKELLERANPLLVLERFGQAKPLPEKTSKTIKFRRYNSLDPTPNPLTEGVTPSGKKMTDTDVSATVVQPSVPVSERCQTNRVVPSVLPSEDFM